MLWSNVASVLSSLPSWYGRASVLKPSSVPFCWMRRKESINPVPVGCGAMMEYLAPLIVTGGAPEVDRSYIVAQPQVAVAMTNTAPQHRFSTFNSVRDRFICTILPMAEVPQQAILQPIKKVVRNKYLAPSSHLLLRRDCRNMKVLDNLLQMTVTAQS